MSQSTLKGLILGLSLIGIADAWYLAQSALTGTPLVCGIENLDGCNVVAQSVYSHLFGIPLAVYGVVFYVLIFIFAAVALYRPRPIVTKALFALGVIGLIASLIFEGIQIFLINAICIYCLGSAVISLLIFILTLMLWKGSRSAQTRTLPTDAVLS